MLRSVPFIGLHTPSPIKETSKSSIYVSEFLILTENSVYSFNLSKSNPDFPTIYSKLIWGSKEIRWDVSSMLPNTFTTVPSS